MARRWVRLGFERFDFGLGLPGVNRGVDPMHHMAALATACTLALAAHPPAKDTPKQP
jgi:hypothetical protein